MIGVEMGEEVSLTLLAPPIDRDHARLHEFTIERAATTTEGLGNVGGNL